MKSIITVLSCLICIQLFAWCNKNTTMSTNPDHLTADTIKVKITVGSTHFTGTLYNNATVTAFKSGLPVTINMKDLNANEKYFDLPTSLPANASNPGRIKTGDLMLYGSNTLVLFYKSFPTSYNYTPIGRIDNPAGLAAALGQGDVKVTFALHQSGNTN